MIFRICLFTTLQEEQGEFNDLFGFQHRNLLA